MLLVLVVVLGGGGFFAWTKFAGTESSSGGTLSLSAAMAGVHFVEMKALTAPFIRDGVFAQYVVLVINLEVANESDVAIVHENKPRLRDAFVSELHALAAVRPPEQRLINLARVKARLLAGASRVLGPGVVRDILVQLAH